MRKEIVLFAMLAVACWMSDTSAEVKFSEQSWTPETFSSMNSDLAIGHDVNFLNFPGAAIRESRGIGSSEFYMLSDGVVGKYGVDGRAFIEGQPATMTLYLGRPRNIKEFAMYTGNIDMRANQDYEVRFANNAANPGVKPEFPKEPNLTTGDKVLGHNGGGYKTSYREMEDGKYLGGGAFDWVEVRFWSTYPLKAGEPAKKGAKASCIVEMQILGDPKDTTLFRDEQEKIETQRTVARQNYERRLQRISSDLPFATQTLGALRAAIVDLGKTYPDKYDSAKYLSELAKYETVLQVDPRNSEQVEKAIAVAPDFLKFRREALLANPLLAFDKVLVRTGSPDLQSNWMSNCSRGKGERNNRLQILKLSDPTAELVPAIEPLNGSFIGDICLNWDAKRMLVTCLSEKKTWEVFEVSLDKPTEFRQISPTLGEDVDNVEGCYLPDGGYLFISSASMMGIPCIGGSGLVGNIFRVESDLKTVRQLTFEQDQDWCPVILSNGRVLYLRWEYVDTPHYFTRLLMHMNPDGSNQIEYYGSNSYWPNSMFYTKPIPNSTKFVTIVTGHHGTARAGELHLFDPTKGRHEDDGHVQQIPQLGQKFEKKFVDNLVDPSWPKFLFPAPLNEKYFLVSAKLTSSTPWGLYLVDTFDNMLLIKDSPEFGIFEPTPLLERPVPPVVASRLVEGEKDSTVFLTDVYFGPGMQEVPRGSVKKLRIFGYQYGYRGIGGHHMMGIQSSWDSKILLGDVPVYEDGSAFFRIPSNTPVAVQPIGEDGSAMQLMRSWLVGMPGEGVTCAGCHESQNSATPSKRTIAMTRPPVSIQPFQGEARPVGFRREVQPVLDKYCVGCHDGKEAGRPDFSDPNIAAGQRFGKSYLAIQKYLRRPGPESDYYLLNPMEYNVNTSYLFQHLRDGKHYNVRLDDDARNALAMWVDMNAPYHATWSEVAAAFNQSVENVQNMAKRTRELRRLYAGIDEDPEHGSHPTVERPAFVKPAEWTKPNTAAPENSAAVVNAIANPRRESVDLGNGVKLDLVEIPTGKFAIGEDFGDAFEAGRNVVTIDKPILMGTTEITNEMYAQFDPHHDSGVISGENKDHSSRGFAHYFPLQPVIRVSWQDANRFCQWLSQKTGKKFRLPTEAEWEWAAKAGTDQPFWWGDLGSDFTKNANFADAEMRLVGRKVADRNDGQFLPGLTWTDCWRMFRKDNAMEKNRLNLSPIECVIPVEGVPAGKGTARYAANPWGLYDMNGNVAEWTQSDFRPYPYDAADGRNTGDVKNEKVVRGGSWYDMPDTSRNGYRLAYPSWQKVFNVGFRVVCEP
ncbi:MAG: SUMF1/EgtB/PvdO family nonheme iron enzyme [Planctomycetia bacterium]|nr:SUMF1/EgtB/PvdO family nonheme iron enzyme [Planctomycetia bacterium]